MDFANFVKPKSILILLVLAIGLVSSIYLVTHPQIFKSKAATDISQAFEISDDQGNKVSCTENVCQTSALKINIKIRDLGLFEKER